MKATKILLFSIRLIIRLNNNHPENFGRLHVYFRRENPTELKEDFEILPERKGEGRFIGAVLGIRALESNWWVRVNWRYIWMEIKNFQQSVEPEVKIMFACRMVCSRHRSFIMDAAGIRMVSFLCTGGIYRILFSGKKNAGLPFSRLDIVVSCGLRISLHYMRGRMTGALQHSGMSRFPANLCLSFLTWRAGQQISGRTSSSEFSEVHKNHVWLNRNTYNWSWGKLWLLLKTGNEENLTDKKSGQQPDWITIGTIGLFFFIFGFVTWLNGILIPYLKISCELNHFQSYLVAFAILHPHM